MQSTLALANTGYAV